MRYASVCSGIEGATLAWQSLGWESVFVSEIEPFPAAVLAHHYPDVPNRRDNAEVDHIIPQARGGTHVVSNLRWVTAEANRAKRDMTDAEFAALCQSVVRWIGERIQMVTDLAPLP